MFEAIRKLFRAEKTAARQLYSVPFSYRKPRQDNLFGTYAYLFAGNKTEAVSTIKSHIQYQGCEFIELIGETEVIPLSEWTQYVNREWAMFRDILPSTGELDLMDKRNKIYVLPSIEQIQ